jgi:hypothetical protein
MNHSDKVRVAIIGLAAYIHLCVILGDSFETQPCTFIGLNQSTYLFFGHIHVIGRVSIENHIRTDNGFTDSRSILQVVDKHSTREVVT